MAVEVVMKQFTDGQLFAWGGTVYKAVGDVQLGRSILVGNTEELVEFNDECDPQLAVLMCTAAGIDFTWLVIGSDTGETGAPEEDEEEVEAY
jgi:hypothetical protein